MPDHADDSASGVLAPPESQRPSPWLWLGVGALLLIALLVVFVLPVVVSEYELPLERRVELVEPTLPAPSAPAPDELSPFEEAVLARERQRAQDVLAIILDSQAELEPLQVGEWAGEAYEAALEIARDGDGFYRNREFEQANASYREAADALTDLLDSVPERIEQALAGGEEALSNGDPARAEEHFNLALLLDPGNSQARAGLGRTENYAEFTFLLDSANESARVGDLNQALATYQRAAALDTGNGQVLARIGSVAEQIRENEFSNTMSAGFALLESGDPEAAIAEFERAAGLGVNNGQAQAAIEQTRNQVASVAIERLRGRIESAEGDEQWRQAAEFYDEVLAIDANVVFALEGRDYAGRRALLDDLLSRAIDDPFRFNDEAVYQEALDVYYTGRSVEDPGPKLAGQLDQLEVLLTESQIPIEARFASDNLTTVTILRLAEMGELGAFQQSSLPLKPGRYTAVGRRPGYRDVRVDFAVGFGQTPAQILVQCVDRLGGRR